MKSSKEEESTQPTQAKEPQEPPLLRPPKDPPENLGDERNQKKSISIDTSARDAMLITSRKVEMITTPKIAYKIIRIANHFIKHILEHYNDDEYVNEDSIWYKKMETCASHCDIIT